MPGDRQRAQSGLTVEVLCTGCPVRVAHPLRQHRSGPTRLTDRRVRLLGQPQGIQPATRLQPRTQILLVRGSHTFMVLPVRPTIRGARSTLPPVTAAGGPLKGWGTVSSARVPVTRRDSW
ncbi:hypothetical protein GCM10009730_64720 [Streptomyces albidochromogenes]